MTTPYALEGRLDYTRRPTASTLLFSLAKQVAKAEKRGEIVDFAIINFAPCIEPHDEHGSSASGVLPENPLDGDYVGRVFFQQGWAG